MIVDFVVTENVHRRHLDTGQRALLALEVEAAYAEAGRQRRIEAARQPRPDRTLQPNGHAPRPPFDPFSADDLNGPPDGHSPMPKVVADLPQPAPEPRSRERAAAALGTSGRAVQRAKALVRDAPDLAAQVRAGNLALDNADRQRRERVKALPKPEPVKPSRTMLTLRTAGECERPRRETSPSGPGVRRVLSPRRTPSLTRRRS